MQTDSAATPAADDDNTALIPQESISLNDLSEAVEQMDDAALLGEFSEALDTGSASSVPSTDSSATIAPGSPKNVAAKRTNQQRSAPPSPEKEDVYEDADACRINTGSTTTSTTSTEASKRRKASRAAEGEEMKQLIADNFPPFASSYKMSLLAQLDEGTILFVAGLIPDLIPSSDELSADVIDQLLNLPEKRERIAYVQQYQRHLIEKAIPPENNREPQVTSTSVPDGSNPDDQLDERQYDESTTVSMSQHSDDIAESVEMPLPEVLPPVLSETDQDDSFAELADGLDAGTWVCGEVSVRSIAGTKPKQRTDCVDFSPYNMELYRTSAGIPTNEVTERFAYMLRYAARPGEILDGPLDLQKIPWRQNLPCGRQPLLKNAGCTGACGLTMNYSVCAGEKCYDMHQFRNRALCPMGKDGPGHGRKWMFWVDELLYYIERYAPSRLPSLAKAWRPQILQNLAWRMWKDMCEGNLRAGKPSPIEEGIATARAEFSQRMNAATTNAVSRVADRQAQSAVPAAPPPTPAQDNGAWNHSNAAVGNHAREPNVQSGVPFRQPRANPRPRQRPRGRPSNASRPADMSRGQSTMDQYADAGHRVSDERRRDHQAQAQREPRRRNHRARN
jgi:hypothetical protein